MVGAAVLEACGALPEGHCARAARERPPCRTPRAPAGGLTLEEVRYPPGLEPFGDGGPG
jgi:tRNA U38,U39,U40 pseudouridine synthase TruA